MVDDDGISEEVLIEVLRDRLSEPGAKRSFAAKLGIPKQKLTDFLQLRRPLSSEILQILGYERVRPIKFGAPRRYRRVK